jgi:hypothetical protein
VCKFGFDNQRRLMTVEVSNFGAQAVQAVIDTVQALAVVERVCVAAARAGEGAAQ